MRCNQLPRADMGASVIYIGSEQYSVIINQSTEAILPECSAPTGTCWVAPRAHAQLQLMS